MPVYPFGRYLAGRVPPHVQEIEESVAVVGAKVIVFPSTVVSIFATVTEIIPVVWSTEAALTLPIAASPTPKLD